MTGITPAASNTKNTKDAENTVPLYPLVTSIRLLKSLWLIVENVYN